MSEVGKRFDAIQPTQRSDNTPFVMSARSRLMEMSAGDYVHWRDKDGVIRMDLPSAVPDYALAQFGLA